MDALNNHATKFNCIISTTNPHFRIVCARKMMDMHISIWL